MDGFTVFKNRFDAGERLTKSLQPYQNDPNAVVLALPRGGVPVAYPIAKKLRLPLHVFVVRKLGAPFQEELAMGAISSGDIIFLNDDVISGLGISQTELDRIIAAKKAELACREKKYYHDKSFPILKGKNIILVDDGIATGATLHAAIMALRKLSPKKLIVAIPVAPREALSQFASLVDELICLHPATTFYGVGAFYDDFSQTTDEEVIRLLENSSKRNFT